MSTSLYEQAIIDATNLKRMAEENARNQVIEAITPQIRALIESEMIKNDFALFESSNELETEAYEKDEKDEEKLLNDTEVKDEKEEIDETELKALEMLINSASHVHSRDLIERANNLRKNLAKYSILKESFDLNKLDQESRMEFLKRFNDLMRESVILRREAILMNVTDSNQIQNLIEKTIKEIKTMSRSLNKTLLNRLFEEAEGDEQLLDMPVDDMGSEEVVDDLGGDEVTDDSDLDKVELPADLARDLMAALEGSFSDESEEVSDDMASEELPVEEMDLNMGMHEGLDQVYDIDVNELRKELRKLQESGAADMADQFGGGEAIGDVFFEIDEEDLINVLADELGRKDVPTPKVESKSRDSKVSSTSKKTAAQYMKEVREHRVINKQLSEAKLAVSKLQEQLSEMNLFNAKLLYANKLMQNKGLTTKQQRAIVEALDGAETLEESKLLYKSLTAALGKSKQISESKKLSSASKSTRPSGQPLNEGVGTTDRWALLAGINSSSKE